MSEEEGQMIFYVGVRASWRIKRGSGYHNVHFGTEKEPWSFSTRMKSVEDMNSNPEMMARLMHYKGLTGKKVFDFHISKEFFRKDISKSFAHKESDYGKQ